MEWEGWSTDRLEQRMLTNSRERSRLDAEDLEILQVLDDRQVATSDGSRNLTEWVASRLDVSLTTAKDLVRTMRRTVDRPHLREALASGDASFDRVEALSRIPAEAGLLEHLDVAGVCREAAKRARITAADESRSWDDRFLVLQPTLDESWWKLWGGLDGVSGALVDKALTAAVDALPESPDGRRMNSAWERASALVQICVSDDPPPAQVTIFIDAGQATPSSGEAGITLEAGPRVGREALQALMCDSAIEVTTRSEDGVPMVFGRRTRSIPPALRRAILHRDSNRCVADGCASRNRLQIHHVIPWSQGGPTDPDNLITLCWFHHQVIVHQRGFTPYRHPDHGRIRFHKPQRAPPV